MLTWCPIILLETETDFIDDGFNASIYNWFSLIFNEYDFSDYNDPDCISLRPFFLCRIMHPSFRRHPTARFPQSADADNSC